MIFMVHLCRSRLSTKDSLDSTTDFDDYSSGEEDTESDEEYEKGFIYLF